MEKRSYQGMCAAVIALIASIVIAQAVTAKESVTKSTVPASQKIDLMVGKSMVLESSSAVKRVSLAAPGIADAIVLTPRQIYLIGKTPGLTNLTLWEGDTILASYDLEVYPDIVRLKEKLHQILPGEENINVTSSNDVITLAGTVSSASALAQATAVAGPFGKVVNLLEVGGAQQVMLEVRVSEITKSTLKRLGINFGGVSADGSKFGLSVLNGLTTVKTQPPLAYPFGSSDIAAPGGMAVSQNVNAIFRFMHNGATWTGFIDALKENGLLTVLAEPTLICLSGQTASFNAGGEVPIPEASGLGTVAITFKKFGVGLSFTPVVLSGGKISMKVTPTVSDIDFANAITANGFLIPSFQERTVSTVVELGDGQSFALAGLLNEKITEDVAKFPVLGDIPILGALFRSSAFKKQETELVIIVTPHLVKPLDMSRQPLPTDKYGEPGDFGFYLMGSLVGKAKERKSAVPVSKSGFDGEVGHIVPQ